MRQAIVFPEPPPPPPPDEVFSPPISFPPPTPPNLEIFSILPWPNCVCWHPGRHGEKNQNLVIFCCGPINTGPCLTTLEHPPANLSSIPLIPARPAPAGGTIIKHGVPLLLVLGGGPPPAAGKISPGGNLVFFKRGVFYENVGQFLQPGNEPRCPPPPGRAHGACVWVFPGGMKNGPLGFFLFPRRDLSFHRGGNLQWLQKISGIVGRR